MKKIKLIGVLTLIVATSFGCIIEGTEPNMETTARKLIDNAVIHLRHGNFNQAEATLLLSVELVTLPEALDGLGCIAFLKGDDQSAESLFLAALSIDSTYTSVFKNLALVYERKGDLQKAKWYYEKAISVDPLDFRARNNFAAFLFEKSGSDNQSMIEILKTKSIIDHPVVENNLSIMEERR